MVRDTTLYRGVEEQAIAQQHRFLPGVADRGRRGILHLGDDRRQASFAGVRGTPTGAGSPTPAKRRSPPRSRG